jgi:phosphatidylglycerophosphatase A
MTISSEKFYLKPDLRLLFSHPAHFFSLGFGTGLMPKGPGTAGTLVGFPLYWLIAPRLNDNFFILFLIVAFFIGVRICDKTSRTLGVDDHGGIVWDEIVAFMLVLFFTPDGIYWQILAFILFRFFDIVKPQPIKHFDQSLHGGFGVMFDDILAAGYALLCLALIKSFLP